VKQELYSQIYLVQMEAENGLGHVARALLKASRRLKKEWAAATRILRTLHFAGYDCPPSPSAPPSLQEAQRLLRSTVKKGDKRAIRRALQLRDVILRLEATKREVEKLANVLRRRAGEQPSESPELRAAWLAAVKLAELLSRLPGVRRAEPLIHVDSAGFRVYVAVEGEAGRVEVDVVAASATATLATWQETWNLVERLASTIFDVAAPQRAERGVENRGVGLGGWLPA